MRALAPALRLWRSPSAPLAAVVAHGSRMVVSLLIVKAIAVLTGPAGLGQLGNFMSVTTMMTVFAGGGIVNGIVKYVAELRDRPAAALRLIGAAGAFGSLVSLVLLVAVTVAARPLAVFLLGSADYWWLLPLLGLCHFLCFFGMATIAVVNGYGRPDMFALITVTGYLVGVPVALGCVWAFGIPGGALALLIVAASPAIPAAVVLLRSRIRPLLRWRLTASATRLLLRFSVMAVASATLFPLTEIAIRTRIIAQLGIVDGGYWQALARFSGANLGFFTVFLATSFMPTLSATRDAPQLVRAVLNMMGRVAIAFAVVAALVLLARHQITVLLFSSAFVPIEPLFGWQLAGDALRLMAYTIGFAAVARASVLLYVGAEALQCVLYAGLVYWTLDPAASLADVVHAYAITYFIYFLVTLLGLWLYARRSR